MTKSPWAQYAALENGNDSTKPTPLPDKFDIEINELEDWGHHQINGFLNRQIAEFPEVSIYEHLHASHMFRGAHILTIDTVAAFLREEDYIETLLENYSSTLNDRITDNAEWPMLCADVITEFQQLTQEYNQKNLASAADSAEYTTRLYAVLAHHASAIINPDDNTSYLNPRMMEAIAIRAEQMASVLAEGNEPVMIFRSHATNEENIIEDGYAALSDFIDERLKDLNRALTSARTNTMPLHNISDEAVDAFKGLARDCSVYGRFLEEMRTSLTLMRHSGIWPTLFEKVAHERWREETSTPLKLTKEDGISQFMVELLRENSDVPMQFKDIAIIGGLFKSITERFPSMKPLRLTP